MILVSLSLPRDHLISVLLLFSRNTRYSLHKGSKIGGGRRRRRSVVDDFLKKNCLKLAKARN